MCELNWFRAFDVNLSSFRMDLINLVIMFQDVLCKVEISFINDKFTGRSFG